MFPTRFAIALARKYKLYIDDNPKRLSPSHKDYEIGVEFHLCLEEFQKFSLTADFVDSCISYIGLKTELTDGQLQGLAKIYKHTRMWVRGQVVDDLLSNMDSDPRALSSIASLVLDVSNEQHDDSSDEDKPRMIIRLTGAKVDDE